MSISFRLLGPLRVERDGRPVVLPTGQIQQLLEILLFNAGQVVDVATIRDLLWDGDAPAGYRKLVQVRVSQLRGIFATAPVTITGSRLGYQLDVPPRSLDLQEFRDLVARAKGQEASAAEVLLRQALDLWRGPALAELAGAFRGVRPATVLMEEYLSAVESHAQAALTADQTTDLADRLLGVLAQHPLRERLRALVMLVLHRSGRQGDALSVFDEGRRLLATELGLDPGAELRAAHDAIVHSTPAAAPSSRTGRVADYVPAQLPADVRGFAGRDGELTRLTAILDADERESTAATIVALSGTAGVGKTALAVHWAHQVADRFPDGQLYINLRGFGPAGKVMEPAEAIRNFLDALGVTPQRMPAEFDAQTALYRSLLSGKRVLVLLDNARDAAQVRPLLPGSPDSMVVITSRTTLSGLVATEGAVSLTVGVLTAPAARELLGRRLGHERIAAEPAAVDEIVSRCAGLSLALAIVAARAATRVTFPLAAIADDLRSAGGGLSHLDGDDPATDIRAVFSWSYQVLDSPAKRLFRLLGLHPGPDFTIAAVAALAGLSRNDVRPVLAELTQANLVTEHLPGRFALHDLLRNYARELADHEDSVADQRLAIERMLDYYLLSAEAADRLLFPIDGDPAPYENVHNVMVEEFAGTGSVLAWFTSEYALLLVAVELAVAVGFDMHTSRLAQALNNNFQLAGQVHDHVAVQRAALAAAIRLGDTAGQAYAYSSLGRASARLERYEEGLEYMQRAMALFVELDNEVGIERTELSVTHLYAMQGDYARAMVHSRRALALSQASGHLIAEARALNNLGWSLAHLGDTEEALRHCERAQTLAEQFGGVIDRGTTTHSIGYIRHKLGRHHEAILDFRRALQLFEQLGDEEYVIEFLVDLGEAQRAVSDVDSARRSWQRALAIADRIEHPYADPIRARLSELAEVAPRTS
ncbi:BTAD domain-containing putative transcriptional regulator [Saccharomonospora sp. NPDC046836]|uniref:AfsR/SARP family transcriptional regulator n=1 Tax=Saccharomonospora sp. NPDC046836 TaxID=3156921 RepID=UPI0033D69189